MRGFVLMLILSLIVVVALSSACATPTTPSGVVATSVDQPLFFATTSHPERITYGDSVPVLVSWAHEVKPGSVLVSAEVVTDSGKTYTAVRGFAPLNTGALMLSVPPNAMPAGTYKIRATVQMHSSTDPRIPSGAPVPANNIKTLTVYERTR